jgi:internalin A
LQQLNCSNSRVSDLSPLASLAQLHQLNCFNTQVSDLSPLASLTQLQQLNCFNTQVSDLSPLVSLTQLQQLDCSNSRVSDLLPILRIIREGIPVIWNSNDLRPECILVRNCLLTCPPVEIAIDSPQAVIDYFEELGDNGRRLNEVKIIILGEASAGKTSLVKRLMDEPFDIDENQTHGIRIRKTPFRMDDGELVTAHLWDFGGQEVMHATHQFFLSRRSIYVLLLNSRNDDQAEKWLKHADSFGGKSPVLVVLNKIDENPTFDVERKSLQEKYQQIRGFFRLSCSEDNNRGFTDFREALRLEIDRSDTRRTPFPAHWLSVKEYFSDMQADYIESSEFRKNCEKHGVIRPLSQDVLLQFLHDLGVVINFRNLQYFDTQILNPLWLTNGVYRIINSGLVAEKRGLLQEDDFDTVINDPRYQINNTVEKQFNYPKNKLHYIVRVMQEFELCYMLNERTYVVPQLLPITAPDFESKGAVLRFVILFPDFMPNSIFPRLMVKLHSFIFGDNRWRTGMILSKPTVFNALARIRWDKEDRKILIDVCGEERRRLLSFIRETVKEIKADFANLNIQELVPVPNCDAFKEYEELVDAEKEGEKEIFVRQLKKRIAISELLDGVEEPTMRDETEQLPVKAFVSYSHLDLEYLKALRSALAPLMRLNKLQLWDDRGIDAGDEWRNEIFQQLEDADIVLCLVSTDFVASDFCYQQEFETALTAHREGKKTIVPIRLRETDWEDLPLSEIQGTPSEWITSSKNRDEAWTQVSKMLRPLLEKVKKRKRALLEKEQKTGVVYL